MVKLNMSTLRLLDIKIKFKMNMFIIIHKQNFDFVYRFTMQHQNNILLNSQPKYKQTN